jgi:NhaA family Na+:H+ antiporter
VPTQPSQSQRLLEWSRTDRAAGVTLAVATAAALAWANANGDGYRSTWSSVPSWLGITGLHLSARAWVNEGLMTLFFVVIGLEIRREMTAGELRSWRRASRPLLGAVGGMAVPALLYLLIVHDSGAGHGWGIPMATDVAFSLGALALVGSHASLRLRVFLMTLAVADDILSVVLLVAVYSADLAAIVGVAVGLGGVLVVAPRLSSKGGPRSWERRLTPVVNIGVLPVFALANVGVDLSRLDLGSAVALRVFLAVLVARMIGKPLGIWPAVGAGRVRERLGVGAAASVGFTVPLLIVRAAFGEGLLADSATAALLTSTVLGSMATAVLLARRRR